MSMRKKPVQHTHRPTTGAAIQIPAMRKPRFIAGTYFKDIVNESATKGKK